MSDSPFTGIQAFSTLDDPGYLACVLFTGGCNYQCNYCHNPDFIRPAKELFKSNSEVERFLISRKGKLSSVVYCGGEPTLHKNLEHYFNFSTHLAYRNKLDTNGSNPKRLNNWLRNYKIDKVSMDLKGMEKHYQIFSKDKETWNSVNKSIEVLLNDGVDFELRLTVHQELHSSSDIQAMLEFCKNKGVRQVYLQKVRTDGPLYKTMTRNTLHLQNLVDANSQSFSHLGLRNADTY